ncbi:MAG TPA: helix-turn-helix transcriptional regulator [Sphingorhabdus sp.]|uniref:helix-turn-helix domain-containing protein n=1 Tax=Sphingorhabdus sp. TaxID=1902408 RepID=UPI002C6E75E6|nr:helix-turn-helix transcriptional regulator [Sphingorhabdus sp.]HMT42696.1 helix-turn-helix transcriptional regulator [Sphingorhabdus sp.]HMU22683.1 helix-turn-helix transcriptional regulator [Sphingorhabdus sp.]
MASNPRTPEEDRCLKALGKAIRDARKSCNISQEALAHISGIDRSHTGKIERGERNVTALNLLRIADALKILPSELFGKAGL